MLKMTDLSIDQLKAIQFIGSGEDSLIAADVGTGKTVIALSAALNALHLGEVDRWLVLAPLLVATDTWALEPERWEHLLGLKVAIACGNVATRMRAIDSDAQIVVMNYENLNWLLAERYARGGNWRREPDPLPFNGLICDEVDKLKAISSKRFKALRNRIGVFEKRIGLTGTLVPNDLTELWGQVYVVDGGQSFGRSFYKWRQKYFYPTDFNQYNWTPFPQSRDALITEISDLVYRIRAKGLPEVDIHEPTYYPLPHSVLADYKELERHFYLMLDDDADKQVDAANAAVLTGKLQQICAGFSYLKDKIRRAEAAHWHTKDKYLDWLPKLMEDIPQLLVVYNFRAELEMLQTLYSLPHIGGGVSNKEARRLIRLWNEGEIPVLAIHPAAAGHGLNLQYSGACDIAFLTLPWSGGLFHQVIGRLARRGNPSQTVNVHTCLFRDTIDEAVFRTISGKLTVMTDFLNALESRTGTGK